MFFFCLVFAMPLTRLFICALWSPAGKGLTSWLSFEVSNCECVTFPTLHKYSDPLHVPETHLYLEGYCFHVILEWLTQGPRTLLLHCGMHMCEANRLRF